ncbi:hypothetical protein C2G38_2217587 [Gigaspora rosea]|uniref:Uncharacterized protein n=1 Tax=Gigaspora rosea TaxID=44941 RepID=A0A397U7P8_9GLOM|nr:hypothetical protein C2G38_2217587 [Gigaspora rosea]
MDVNQIEETWAIRTITSSKFCHFVIFFPIRLMCVLALGLWYKDINVNLQEELFYVATQFGESHPQYQPAEQMSCNTNKLFTPLADLRSERKEDLLTEIQEDVLANDSNNDSEET